MKPKIFFWRRMCSIFIDLSFVYCLTVLLQAIIWNFTFISFPGIFVITFLIYYLCCYLLFNGKTISKQLTNLTVVTKGNANTKVNTIVMRDVILKWLTGLIIPFFILRYFFQLWSVLHTLIVGAIVIIITVIFLFTVKIQWWELLSGSITVYDVPKPQNSRRAFWVIFITIISGVFVINYASLVDRNYLFKEFSPKYPVTKEVKDYAKFIKDQQEDPVDYIFDLFKKYDLIVISERIHSEYSQYELITKIVTDKRFTDSVGNLYTECGSISFQDTLNSYLQSTFTSESELNKATAILQRNSNAVWPLWSNTNLFDLLQTVNKVNSKLQNSGKIKWYFTDLPVDWRAMSHQKFIEAYTTPFRDSIMAGHIIAVYNGAISKQKRHRALIIMNSRHGYGLLEKEKNQRFTNEYMGTTAYLMKSLPGKVANVFLNSISIQYAYMMTPVQNGKWDRAFSLAGNPNSGFNFSGSPFGEDQFDAAFFKARNVFYKDIFTGFIFYQPLSQHFQKNGFPNEFDNFEDTILQRASYINSSSVEGFKTQIKHYKQNPKDPVASDPLLYAVLYNLVAKISVSIFLLLNLLFAFFFLIFQRNYRQG
jgi:hypothetical protein